MPGEILSSPKAHTITWPFSAKTGEDLDYNFDVLLNLLARLIARVNTLGGGVTSIPTQTSNLLQSNVHRDTRTQTRVLGDLIQALGPMLGSDLWSDGQSAAALLTAEDAGGQRFWFDGQAFEGAFGGASSPDVLWDRLPIGPATSFLKSTGTVAEWGPLGDVGVITASDQPCAKVYTTSNQLITEGANAADFYGGTRVDFHAVAFDSGFWSAGAPSRLTVPAGEGGKYLITAQASFQTAAAGRRAAWIYKNNVRLGITESCGDDGGLNLSFCVATMTVLEPADYIELFCRVDNTGGDLFVLGDASYADLTHLTILKVA